MNARHTVVSVIVLFVVLLPTVNSAQWLKHPTPGMPRTSDGKPDLSAPAPRAENGTPDLSGLWRAERDVQSDFKPTDALPWAQEQASRFQGNLGTDTWAVLCLPPGPMINFTGPLKIVQTTGVVTVLYETSNNYRQIFTDGRELPQDPNPTWQGYSVGHWDSNTLVVETIGFNDRSRIGRPSYPHTEVLRITERYHRRDFGHLDVDLTVDDPKTFSRRWNIHGVLEFQPDSELLEFVCNENEKDRQHFVVNQDSGGSRIQVAVTSLRKYVGTYEVIAPNGRKVIVSITLDGDQLRIDGSQGPHSPLVPQSDRLFLINNGAVIEFIVNEQGIATHLVGHVAEGEFRGPRIVE